MNSNYSTFPLEGGDLYVNRDHQLQPAVPPIYIDIASIDNQIQFLIMDGDTEALGQLSLPQETAFKVVKEMLKVMYPCLTAHTLSQVLTELSEGIAPHLYREAA